MCAAKRYSPVGDGGPLRSSIGSSSTRPLALKFKSLGIDADGLDVIVQVVKQRARVSAGAAYVWGSFFTDVNLYLLVGLGSAIFGAALIASEVSSGSIFILLSRPLSPRRSNPRGGRPVAGRRPG